MEPWHVLYYRLAEVLFLFHKKYGAAAGQRLFELCFSNKLFREKNNWIQKFPKDFKIRSLDPIHIFATINSGTIAERTKVERAEIVFEILTDTAITLQVDYSGCPAPSIIYLVGARSEEMQQEIWKVFADIYVNKQVAVSDTVFRKIKTWYGVDIGSFTIFLFWIDSSNFLPLDSNTVNILISIGKLNRRVRSAKDYLDLLTEKETDVYRELALLSYHINKLGKKDIVYSKKLNEYLGLQSVENLTIDCKLVALELVEDKTGEYFKILKPNTLYQFYNSFEFDPDGDVRCIEEKEIDLYHVGRLRANISAIVGQNGSGKSTLAELLFIVINNLAKNYLDIHSITTVEGLSLKLYIRTTTLFRIDLKDEITKVYRYEAHDNKFNAPKEIDNAFQLNQLFYTIAINYSHYGLNERRFPWLSSLFHKNDSYQLPLVLNPKRVDGNIDINRENEFVKTRLLANILMPITDTETNNMRQISDDKSIKILRLKLNNEKSKKLSEFSHSRFEFVYKSAAEILDFEDNGGRHSVYLKRYIVYKLIKIAGTYDQYKPFFNQRTKMLKLNVLETYLKRLKSDSSHITFKLRQAINLLQFKHIPELDQQYIEVEDLATTIEKLVVESRNRLRTIDLIPPSIFDVQLIMSDGSDFSDLSSGEKQRVFTVSNVIYHIRNLTSIENKKGLLRYDFINILFDEIELYYHPEMQRTFIKFLLTYIEKSKVLPSGLNICFITHSPLILSDIPNQNILFLTEHGLPYPYPDKKNTFGANIHELLADSFFLRNGFIGEYAKDTIENIIKTLNELRENQMKGEKSALTKEKIESNKLKATINLIGEKFIREKLLDMFYSAFPEEFASDVAKQERISELENELLRLRNDYTTA